MKKFFIAVLSISVIAFVGFGIHYIVAPVNTLRPEYMAQEDSINTNGFIIRDEWVMYTRSAGTVYYSVPEGERVARDSVIGSFFYGDVSENSIKELTAVDNKIKNANFDANGSSARVPDTTNVENNIYEYENRIIAAADDNDILSISKYKNDINSLRQNNTLSSDNSAQELEAQKERILREIGFIKEDITANISGVFTTYTDGYEELLVPSDIVNYDVAYFESLSQSPRTQRSDGKVDAGGAAGKIVNNHVWYVMMDISSDIIAGHNEGDSVKIRFNNMADIVIDGEIYHISPEQNGRNAVTVKCSTYIENAFAYRFIDVDLIFKSYDGYKIPVHAIRTDEDGRQKVIGISGGKQYDCYCDLLFTNAEVGYAIVESTADAVNKLSQMERILVGER
ncbi:MAG: hypothetical protein J1F01_05920 [Oscillospiraceae bacterium]|nr:hypothetical protein [Oscillospiraceae bacterium]